MAVLVGALLVGVVAGVQEWEEEPGYREVNPGGEVVMVCRVRNKGGECRCEHLLIALSKFMLILLDWSYRIPKKIFF